MVSSKKKLVISGIRGVPGAHGGFETFAEHLARHLVANGWEVSVYCQADASDSGLDIWEDEWEGVRRIHVPVSGDGALATIKFDWRVAWDGRRRPGLHYVLGYNTALFNLMTRLSGRRVLMNMDGVEWRRDKWRWFEKAWLYLNERAGCLIANHLVADHPEIENHLATRVPRDKITMIPYGAFPPPQEVERAALDQFGVQAGGFLVSICRIEPENHVLEAVKAFSSVAPEAGHLVVLGNLDLESNAYHRAVRDAADPSVKFVGAIYDPLVVGALRRHALAYYHGHSVGGTNPSLVEALAAGAAIIAHDNHYNRWVAGDGQAYFADEFELAAIMRGYFGDPDSAAIAGDLAFERHAREFSWPHIFERYDPLLALHA